MRAARSNVGPSESSCAPMAVVSADSRSRAFRRSTKLHSVSLHNGTVAALVADLSGVRRSLVIDGGAQGAGLFALFGF